MAATGTPIEANAEAVSHGMSIAKSVFAAKEPRAAFEALDRGDRAAFDSVVRLARTSTAVTAQGVGANAGKTLTTPQAAALATSATGSTVSALFSGCWSVSRWAFASARAGNTLYTYGQSTQVCVTSGTVTGISVFNVWNETSTPGWRIEKDPTTRTFGVGWEGRGLAQYYFVLGVGGWDIQHPTTCLQQRLRADGFSASVSTSCNLS